MISALFIVLALLWVVTAATILALERRRPWQLDHTNRRQVWFVQRLEALRHSLRLFYWLLSILLVAEAALLCAAKGLAPVVGWVLGLAIVALGVVHQEIVQSCVLGWLQVVAGRYKKYLGFVATILRTLEPLAGRLFPDLPYFRTRQELTHFVTHHHQAHQVLSTSEHRRLDLLLKADSQPISHKIIPLKNAVMVKAEDTIGPLLLSELHDSPYASFPVYDMRRARIVGVLDQGVAMSHATKGAKVAKIMEERVVYLPADAAYTQALTTFAETSSSLSVIIDKEKQPIGILYVQDIVRELFEREENNEGFRL